MKEKRGKSYQVNTDVGELTKEMHTARMTGVLVYLAGISPLVRGLQRQTDVIGHHSTQPPALTPALSSTSCLLIFSFLRGLSRMQGTESIQSASQGLLANS